jgi:hypothetical protein
MGADPGQRSSTLLAKLSLDAVLMQAVRAFHGSRGARCATEILQGRTLSSRSCSFTFILWVNSGGWRGAMRMSPELALLGRTHISRNFILISFPRAGILHWSPKGEHARDAVFALVHARPRATTVVPGERTDLPAFDKSFYGRRVRAALSLWTKTGSSPSALAAAPLVRSRRLQRRAGHSSRRRRAYQARRAVNEADVRCGLLVAKLAPMCNARFEYAGTGRASDCRQHDPEGNDDRKNRAGAPRVRGAGSREGSAGSDNALIRCFGVTKRRPAATRPSRSPDNGP